MDLRPSINDRINVVQSSSPFGGSTSGGLFGASAPVSLSPQTDQSTLAHKSHLFSPQAFTARDESSLIACIDAGVALQAFGAPQTPGFGAASSAAFGSTTFGVNLPS